MTKAYYQLQLSQTLFSFVTYYDNIHKFELREINNVLYGFFNLLKKAGYLSNVKLIESNK